MTQLKLTLVATFTAEPVADTLAFWLEKLAVSAEITFAPYNQVFQQLLDTNSLLSRNEAGYNILLIRFSDWLRYDSRQDVSGGELEPATVERNAHDLVQALSQAAARSSASYLVFLCPEAVGEQHKFVFDELEAILRSGLEGVGDVHLFCRNETLTIYPLEVYEDAWSDRLGHIPYTPLFYNALGTLLARKIAALRRSPYKVIVLDCDNTLWQGVVGEAGAQGVELSGPYLRLQAFMIEQFKAGMLLCLVSKNTEEDVLSVFDQRSDMLLHRNHIVSRRINWQPKSANIQALAQELQLGLDSFIMVDDNLVECAAIQAELPEVLTLQLPAEPDRIPKFLGHVWPFDHLHVTHEDLQRTALYQQNMERDRFRQVSINFTDFLAGLELEIDITPMAVQQQGRVAQLTQRTNQFNMTSVRRTESDINRIRFSQSQQVLVTHVSDRFGDYGLVGVLIYDLEDDAVRADTFLLSCRVLGRGVEHRMLAQLGLVARGQGMSRVIVPFRPTRQNQPALDFLECVGGEYRRPALDAEGYEFVYPADFVAALDFPSSTLSPDISPLKPVVEGARSAAIADPELWQQIAVELAEPEQIAVAVAMHRRQDRPDIDEAFVAPQIQLQQFIAGLWCEELGLVTVGIHDNFFSLGGDSICGAMFINRLQQKLGETLPIVALFQAPTISQFVEYLRSNCEDAVSRVFPDAMHVSELSGHEQPRSSGNPELPAEPEHEGIEQLMSRLEQLPDKDIDTLLSNLRADKEP